jgi:hypothetical protein
LRGLGEKWGTALAELWRYGTHAPYVASVLTVTALTVQGLFLLLRWQPKELWWRVGAGYAVLMLCLAQPVWEGYPGAASRVVLPLTLAFNVLVPRGVRWLPVLILGNVTLLVAPQELRAPVEFFAVKGPPALAANLQVQRGAGWYAPEMTNDFRWRWSAGEGALRLTNATSQPIWIAVRGFATSSGDTRRLRVSVGEAMVWSEEVTPRTGPLRFGAALPPGETVITFKSDGAPLMVDTDPRPMAFKIMNLEIVATPTSRQP